jgi:cysteine desulfurase
MQVNNETGNVYPISEIVTGLQAKNPNTLLHTDAVQGFLKVDCSAKKLGADFIAISAHKIGGPKGIGGLYVGPRVHNPRPLLPGGGQESGFRSGTEATAQIAGFAKAVELRCAHLPETWQHMAAMKAYAKEKLSTIPDLTFVAAGTAPHVLAISLPGYPSQNLVNDLSEHGICISAGSACHQGKASQVTAALGLSKKIAAGVVRLSFGPETTYDEIDAAAAAILHHRNSRFPML